MDGWGPGVVTAGAGGGWGMLNGVEREPGAFGMGGMRCFLKARLVFRELLVLMGPCWCCA